VINALIAAWANERLCVVPDRPESGWQTTAELYSDYGRWCQRQGWPLMTPAYFTRRLRELDDIEIRRHARGRIVVGAGCVAHLPPHYKAAAFVAKSRQAEPEKTAGERAIEALREIERVAIVGNSELTAMISAIAAATLDAIDPSRAPADLENDF
jgi:hypothetical protein